VPSFEQLEIYCQKHGIPFTSKEEIIKHPDILKLYRERIDERTKGLGQVEKVKKFVLLPQEFSQETGELTPTMKIKRKIISSKYKDIIDSIYAE
jgi:long-chain acyl-CoA synthetase